MHVDADEVRLPPHSNQTLAQALEEVDRQGYNAVNFLEYTFVPTLESPDHDHPDFQRTMRWYYPFLPSFPHRRNAWKRQSDRIDLTTHGGHRVEFPNLKMYPQSFPMRHYLYLSVPHAIRKYVHKSFDPTEVAAGWHGERANMTAERVNLTSRKRLRTYVSDHELDPSNPRVEHFLFAAPGERVVTGLSDRSGRSLFRRSSSVSEATE
jgi:hypothetical protein